MGNEKAWEELDEACECAFIHILHQHVSCTQISTADRTHARTGLDTQRAQAHNHTQNSNPLTHPRQTSRSHAQSHTHTSRSENDANQQTTPPRITATLTQPPPRASAFARGTIACAAVREIHRPLRQRLRPRPAASGCFPPSPAAAPAAPAQPRQAGGG